jgi:uncharacterized protein
MELTGEIAIPASRERVWAALNDPEVLRACIPGCEEVVDESPDVRKARVLVKVGPVRARFSGRVTVSEATPPQRCVMGFEGSGGAAGIASGSSQVELHEEGPDTRLTYTVKAAVGGKLGQVGGRMIEASARQLADQFFAALRLQLAPAEVATPAETDAGVVVAANAARRLVLSESEPQVAAPPIASARVLADAHHQPARSALASVPALATEAPRVLWFLLGAASTGFGVWLARVLA